MSLSTVHILLATYNGEHYLPQQWASAEAQRGVDVVLHLADDGSIDEIMDAPAGALRAPAWRDPRSALARYPATRLLGKRLPIIDIRTLAI
jgi:hypothetical protein